MPDIFRMPTIAEQLGPSLDQIGSSIAHFVNPNHDIQVQLRQSLAQNPELLQKLIDLGPEKVGQLFGKQAAFLGNGQISLGEQVKRTATDKFNTDPTFKDEYFAKATGTQNSQERQKEALDISGKETSNKMNESQLKVQQQTEQAQVQQFQDLANDTHRKITETQAAIAKFPDLSSIDVGKLARRMANGQNVDPAVLKRLSDAGVNFGEIVNSLQQQAGIAAQFSIAKLREQGKEVQSMALNHIERRIDDTRNKMIEADNVIKSMNKDVNAARLFIAKPRPTDEAAAAMWDSKKAIVDTYNSAVAVRQEAEKEYNRYNPVYNQLLDHLVGKEGIKALDEETVPNNIYNIIEGAKQLHGKELNTQVEELKTQNPQVYMQAKPYLDIVQRFNKNDAAPIKPPNIIDKINNNKIVKPTKQKDAKTNTTTDNFNGVGLLGAAGLTGVGGGLAASAKMFPEDMGTVGKLLELIKRVK